MVAITQIQILMCSVEDFLLYKYTKGLILFDIATIITLTQALGNTSLTTEGEKKKRKNTVL